MALVNTLSKVLFRSAFAASHAAPAVARAFGSMTFISREGEKHQIPIEEDQTLLDACDDAGIFADGRCAGGMTCGGCAVLVDDAWIEKVNDISPLDEDEEACMDKKCDRTDNMRLACAVTYTEDLDGLIVTHAQKK